MLSSLLRSNQSILKQKVGLIEALIAKHGPEKAKEIYKQACPIAKASIGQHVRHSMDHQERVVTAALQLALPFDSNGEALPSSQHQSTTISKTTEATRIHYDLRERGGDDENDIDEATKRIKRVLNQVEHLQERYTTSDDGDASDRDEAAASLATTPLLATFFLSGNLEAPDEQALPTTLAREWGFVAHHAIHHMAMVQIIATTSGGLRAGQDLPEDLGRAPSTVQFDQQQQ